MGSLICKIKRRRMVKLGDFHSEAGKVRGCSRPSIGPDRTNEKWSLAHTNTGARGDDSQRIFYANVWVIS